MNCFRLGRIVSLFLLVFSFALVGCQSEATPEPNGTSIQGDSLATLAASAQSRVILQGADLGGVVSEIAKNGGQVVRKMEFVDALVANVPAQALNGLKRKFPGIQVTEDIVLSAIDPALAEDLAAKAGKPVAPPPAQAVPWGVAKIRATEANAINRGQGIKVCIVDTGIDKTHPDLASNIDGGRNFVVNRGTVDPNDWNDDNGHGSHVSGTVAAVDNSIGAIGVAPAARLYGVKVLDRRGSGYLSDVADGVSQCITAGAQVINMSLGATADPSLASPLKTAVDAAAAAGIKVVVAAGNEGESITTKVPAGYSTVIAVSAFDSSQAFPTWSNFDLTAKDFAAPGVGIYSTWKSGGYNTISGTSMASPHVAGVVALQLSAGKATLGAVSIGAAVSRQGAGRIDALLTVQ